MATLRAPGNWSIEARNNLGFIDVTLEADVKGLPAALLKLHEMGQDLSGVIEVAHGIEEEQRKRKVEEAARQRFKELTATYFDKRSKAPRRFVVTSAREGEIIQSHEGIEYGDGGVHVHGTSLDRCGAFTSMKAYKEAIEYKGYSYHIEYED